jgi:mRNA interferase MazF
MKKREIKQGDIYMVNLDDGIDSEEHGSRPCICISCNSLTKNRKNVIIAPITSSKTKKDMVNHYELSKDKYPEFLYDVNTVLLECIRDISKSRLERYLFHIEEQDLDEILQKIMYDFIELP